MRKTMMGRELRKESIACRPCSLNFDDKLLRGKWLIFVQHSFYVCHFLFAFYHGICVYVFEFLKEKTHQNLAFIKCSPPDRYYHLILEGKQIAINSVSNLLMVLNLTEEFSS